MRETIYTRRHLVEYPYFGCFYSKDSINMFFGLLQVYSASSVVQGFSNFAISSIFTVFQCEDFIWNKNLFNLKTNREITTINTEKNHRFIYLINCNG